MKQLLYITLIAICIFSCTLSAKNLLPPKQTFTLFATFESSRSPCCIFIDTKSVPFKGELALYRTTRQHYYDDDVDIIRPAIWKKTLTLPKETIKIIHLPKRLQPEAIKLQVTDHCGKEIRTNGYGEALGFVCCGKTSANFAEKISNNMLLYGQLEHLPESYEEFYGSFLYIGSEQFGKLPTAKMTAIEAFIKSGGFLTIIDNSPGKLPGNINHFFPKLRFDAKETPASAAILEAILKYKESAHPLRLKQRKISYRNPSIPYNDKVPFYINKLASGAIYFISIDLTDASFLKQLRMNSIMRLRFPYLASNRLYPYHNRYTSRIGSSGRESFSDSIATGFKTPALRVIIIFLTGFASVHFILFVLLRKKRLNWHQWLTAGWISAALFILIFSGTMSLIATNKVNANYNEQTIYYPSNRQLACQGSLHITSSLPVTLNWNWKNIPTQLKKPSQRLAPLFRNSEMENIQPSQTETASLSSMGHLKMELGLQKTYTPKIACKLEVNCSNNTIDGFIENKSNKVLSNLHILFPADNIKLGNIEAANSNYSCFSVALPKLTPGQKHRFHQHKLPIKATSHLQKGQHKYSTYAIIRQMANNEPFNGSAYCCLVQLDTPAICLPRFKDKQSIRQQGADMHYFPLIQTCNSPSFLTNSLHYISSFTDSMCNTPIIHTKSINYFDNDSALQNDYTIDYKSFINQTHYLQPSKTHRYIPRGLKEVRLKFQYKIFPGIPKVNRKESLKPGAFTVSVLNLKTGNWDQVYNVKTAESKKELKKELVAQLNQLRLIKQPSPCSIPKKNPNNKNKKATDETVFGIFGGGRTSSTTSQSIKDLNFTQVNILLKESNNYLFRGTNYIFIRFEYYDNESKIGILNPKVKMLW